MGHWGHRELSYQLNCPLMDGSMSYGEFCALCDRLVSSYD